MSRSEGQREPAPFTYEMSRSESPSSAVVAAVATALNRRPVASSGRDDAESEPILEPLYGSIDPDALDAIFRDSGRETSSRGRTVTFRYHDCGVTVTSEGVVEVRPP